MKKTLLSLGLLLSSVILPNANAQLRYFEGKDYKVLQEAMPLNKAGQPEVVEIFSYTCPHCHNLEHSFMEWVAEKKPKNVGFYKIHATGGTWNFPARVHNVAKKLGLGEDFDNLFFEEIFKKNNRRLAGDKDTAIEFIAKAAKIEPSVVKKTWDSLHVKSALKRTDEYLVKLGLGSVPTVVVNGQYVVQLSEYKRFFSVIEFLLETKGIKSTTKVESAKETPKAVDVAATEAVETNAVQLKEKVKKLEKAAAN